MSPIILHQINGAAYCCLASGMEPRAFAHSAVTDYLHDACLRIASDGTVQEFYLNETLTFFNTEKGREEVGIVLPLREAQPLIGLACPDTEDAAAGAFRDPQALLRAEAVLRKLYRLFSYLIAAYKQCAVSEAFFRAIVSAPLCLLAKRGTDGGAQDLIVLSPRLVLRCVTAETAVALRFHYPWVHPDGGRAALEAAALFFLATLSYACITGAPPFNSAAVPFAAVDGDDFCANGAAEQLVQNIRDGVYVPVELRCPALCPQFARLINGGLAIAAGQGSAKTTGQYGSVKSTAYKSIGLEKTVGGDIMPNCRAAPLLPLVEQLCSYCDESLPIFAGVQVAEDSAQRAALEAFAQTARKRISRKRFVRRNSGKIAAAAVLCAALIAVTAAVVVHLRKPSETAGMSAEAVIRGFYTAVGTLDQTITGAYTKNKAAALYDGLMVHLYVTGKTREAYERKKIYYTPQEFFTLCESAQSVDAVQGEFTAAADDANTSVENVGGNNAENTPPSRQKSNTEDEHYRYKKAIIESLGGGSVYGISGLHIESATQTGWFDVTFYHWLPLFSSEAAEEAAQALEASMSSPEAPAAERLFFPVQILYKHDRVQVITVKDSFFIGAIESAENRVVVESSDALLEACTLPPDRQPDYLKLANF